MFFVCLFVRFLQTLAGEEVSVSCAVKWEGMAVRGQTPVAYTYGSPSLLLKILLFDLKEKFFVRTQGSLCLPGSGQAHCS